MTGEPYIPTGITVHLGAPDAAADNVTVSFADYIKNVASSEIYPTWPDSALRANIYAQISFALNRLYTEWYRSRGYAFDITNSTRYDQAFVNNRVTYESVNRIVDEIFNSYVRRQGSVEPYFTQYCNGTTVTCEGLSQWGTVALAEQGLGAYDILTRYYGTDIELVQNVPVRNGTPSYPGTPLQLGSTGAAVQLKQLQLNRVSENYPAIPKIAVTDGLFDMATERAVRAYQRIFDLTEDGIVGAATWNSLSFVYAAVKRLAELDSEGITISELPRQWEKAIGPGDEGTFVQAVQYYLAVVAEFDDRVPSPAVNGQFDTATEQAVLAFQRESGLTEDGIVGLQTWNRLYSAYRGIVQTVPPEGGVPRLEALRLREGDSGEEVRRVQTYLDAVARQDTRLPEVTVDGLYGPLTAAAVRAFQEAYGLPVTGEVGVSTYDRLAEVYMAVTAATRRQEGQAPGYTVGAADTE